MPETVNDLIGLSIAVGLGIAGVWFFFPRMFPRVLSLAATATSGGGVNDFPRSTPAAAEVTPHTLRRVMRPHEFHQRQSARLATKNAERERRTPAVERAQAYITEKRREILRKHAAEKELTKDDLLILLPFAKSTAGLIYDVAQDKTEGELTVPELSARRMAQKRASAA